MTTHAQPRTISLPWVVLVPDNRRVGILAGRGLLSRRYRAAKGAAHVLCAGQWRGAPMLAGDVAIVGRFYLPDRRRRDVGNLRKLITDALAGVAYADDVQLADERWVRVGVDRENPRVVLTLTPFTPLAAFGAEMPP